MDQASSISWGFILFNLICVLLPLILAIYFGNRVYKLSKKAREGDGTAFQQEVFLLFKQLPIKQQLNVSKYIEQQIEIARNASENFEFEAWRDELLLTGNLSDGSTRPEDLYKWDRYPELVEMADGIFEEKVFRALVDSMQVEYDHEVYEYTVRILLNFPPESFGKWLVRPLPALISRVPNKAGDLLNIMTLDSPSHKDETKTRLVAFNETLMGIEKEVYEPIRQFILDQERDGWLDDKPGHFNSGINR